MAVEAVNCNDATALAREQVEAQTKEDVLPVLGKIGAKLRRKLGGSQFHWQFDCPIEQATTPSLDALKSYSLGLRAGTRVQRRRRFPLLEHAAELDLPTFAMAYADWALSTSNLGETRQAPPTT